MGSHPKPGSQGFWHVESPLHCPRWTGLSLRRPLTLWPPWKWEADCPSMCGRAIKEEQQLLLPADATSCYQGGLWKHPSLRQDEKSQPGLWPPPAKASLDRGGLAKCLPVVFFHFCNRMWHQWVHFHTFKYPISGFISIFKWAWKHHSGVQVVVPWSW